MINSDKLEITTEYYITNIKVNKLKYLFSTKERKKIISYQSAPPR